MKGVFLFKISVWIILCCMFYKTQAALKTYYVHERCYSAGISIIDLTRDQSGILKALSNSPSCDIMLSPRRTGHSVVLSINRYDLDPEDQLIIEDSDGYKIALVGYGDFSDERKSIISEGPLVINFKRNGTRTSPRVFFQFTFTDVTKMPCGYGQFQCRNRKCVSNDLLCDHHNHCGDLSDQENCVPKNTLNDVSYEERHTVEVSPWVISIYVASAILFVVIIVFIVYFVRRVVKRKKSEPAPQTVAAAVVASTESIPSPSNPSQPTPSLFNQIRRSFRSLRNPKTDVETREEQKSENYQVPSMYPPIPTAPELSGVDNPEFRADV